jgi:AcrR family transcriptional regulator
MARRIPRVHLANAELDRRDHHVCAVFDDDEIARATIDEFVLDGITHGQRVIEVAEVPGSVIDRLAPRRGVRQALGSGQFEVRPWTDAYLAGGSFRAAQMLAYVRRLMREVDTERFAGARLIGTMEWAVDGLDGVDELLAYETGLNRILARPRVTVLCAYDVRRHPEQRLREIMAVHDAAVVDGVLTQPVRAGTRARERILAAAALLFAENGVARTGVDTLIEAAGVAKATFYRHFPSKDDLVVAWLRAPGTRWLESVRPIAEARATSARDVLPQLFDALATWLEDEDYVASPYFNAAVMAVDPADPVAVAIRDHNAEVHAYLVEVLAAMGHRDPEALAHEVHVLIAGAIALGVATRSSSHALAARTAAMKLIGSEVAGPRHNAGGGRVARGLR